MIELVYLAAPLGADVDGGAARARRWLRWLIDREPDVAFSCPWLPYVDAAEPSDKLGGGVAAGLETLPPFRQRAFRDDLESARRCNGIVLVGGHISKGMSEEARVVGTSITWWRTDRGLIYDPTPVFIASREAELTTGALRPMRGWVADLTSLGPAPRDDLALPNPLEWGRLQWQTNPIRSSGVSVVRYSDE